MLKGRIKSFGIIEAMVASIVIILVLTGAIALTTNLVQGSTLDSSYQEAETVAEEVFSQIEAAKAAGSLYFVASADAADTRFPIECFDNSVINDATNPDRARCFTDANSLYNKLLSFYTLGDSGVYAAGQFDANSFFTVSQNRNKAISEGFFKVKTTITRPAGNCQAVGGVTIPSGRCRRVDVKVQWEGRNGTQTYQAVERFFDW